jgi:RND family efflux transporter MFP subunit
MTIENRSRRGGGVRGARRVRGVRGLILGAGALVAIGQTGCGRHEPKTAQAATTVEADTATAVAATVPRLVSAPGTLEAVATAQVSTRMMGWVRRVHVQAGEPVKVGTPLVSIDDGDLRAKRAQVEAQVEEARAAAENAQKTAARFEKLYQDKAVSGQQLDDVRTGAARAQAGLRAALAGRDEVDTNLRYLDVTAPIGGIVARKLVDPGDMASPGTPLVVIEQTDRMKIVARIGEKDVDAVAAGDSVSVDVTSLPGAVFRAVIDRVVPAADPGTRTFDVEITIPNPSGRLKSGMFARALLPVGSRRAIVIPAAAVSERGQLRGVFVRDQDGAVALRWVKLGRRLGDQVEILSGLDGGETVVLRAARPLAEGIRVVTR